MILLLIILKMKKRLEHFVTSCYEEGCTYPGSGVNPAALCGSKGCADNAECETYCRKYCFICG